MGNNFTIKAENALNNAVSIAEDLGHTYVGSEHILLSLAKDETSCASMILRKRKLTYERLDAAVREYSGIGAKSNLSSRDTTPKCRKILENSYKCSKKYSSQKIGTEHILLALLEEKETVCSKLLTKVEADTSVLKDDIVSFLRNTERGVVFGEPIAEASIPNLLKYGKHVNKMAERGELDPVIGRDKETERLIRILSRKSKNNPCLIGEAGVGKTAIIEGLAQRINEGRVPSNLIGKTIISLDLTSMVSGAKYRGDFEERIKSVMNEAAKNKSIILFIDEIHTIVGAGSAEGAIDAANIMKPELSRGNIQLIGATTHSEYKKYIEKDAALERRFQPVLVEEPTLDGTVEILKGLRPRYEKHHNIRIDDSAIYAAAKLSQRYIQDRYLPDKAIDILDEACAYAGMIADCKSEKNRNIKDKIRQIKADRLLAISEQNYEMATNLSELERLYAAELNEEISLSDRLKDSFSVCEDDVKHVLYEIVGVDILDENRVQRDLETKLSEKIIGQNDAIKCLCNAVTRGLADICDPERPRGIFLFLGESGVGKTALAKLLSEELFNSNDALIRFDMSEYSESYSISKIIGSAPGYIGYDDAGSSLDKIRRHPYSVILLDEIEKAHPDILALFLQVFDSGYITDSSGRKISLKNCYIIMTSNICADKGSESRGVGFLSNENTNIRERLTSFLSPEFINRIDEIVKFNRLDKSALKQIAKIRTNELVDRLYHRNIILEIDENAIDQIAQISSDEGFSARSINRIISSEIENKIAHIILKNDHNTPKEVYVSLCEGCITVQEKVSTALR